MANFAKSTITVNDISTLVNNAVTGVNALHGVTERGEEGKTYLCRNWEEYTRNLGGLLDPSVSLFPQYCKRILDAGGIIRVSRAFHYTDVDDLVTNTSTIASANNTGGMSLSGNVIYFEDSSKTVTIAGDFTDFLGTGDPVTLNLPNAGGSLVDTVVSATLTGGNTVLVLTTFTAGDVTLGSTVEWSITLAGDLSVQAKEYGSWANGKLWFRIDNAISGALNAVDIHIGLDGYPSLDEVLVDVPNNITTSADLQDLSDKSRWVTFLSNTLSITPLPKRYFIFGNYDSSSINTMDIIGSALTKTGIHTFDDDYDFVRISIPEYTQNVLDEALVNYVQDRKDCVAVLRVPTGVSNTAAVDYRYCRSLFAGGNPIDTWQALMTMTDIEIVEEYNEKTIPIPSLPDYLALSTVKDNRDGAWGSAAGIQNNKGAGVIVNTTGVGNKNLASRARKAEADAVAAAGLIPVIDKPTNRFGLATMVWGNSTMQLAQNTLLRFAHVAELVIYMQRTIKPILDENLFEPNDPLTWKNIYRAINQLMRTLQTQRAISDYDYVGDQNADTIFDATYNQLADIQNGVYKFKVIFVPASRIEQIEATFTITNNIIGVELTNA